MRRLFVVMVASLVVVSTVACGNACRPGVCNSYDGVDVDTLCGPADAGQSACTVDGQATPPAWPNPGQWFVVTFSSSVWSQLGTRDEFVVTNDAYSTRPADLLQPEVLVDGAPFACESTYKNEVHCPNIPHTATQLAFRYSGPQDPSLSIQFQTSPFSCTICAE